MSTPLKPDSQLPSGNQAIHSEKRYLDTEVIDRAIQVVKQERNFDAMVEAVRAQLPQVYPLLEVILNAAPWQERQKGA